MDAAGVDRAVVISPYVYQWDMRYAMDCWEAHGEWLAVGVLVEPRAPDGPERLRDLVARGASGVRIHGKIHGQGPFDDPATTPLWEAAADLDLPLDACAGLDEYPEVERRARQFPSLRIILDHCGYVSPWQSPPSPQLEPVLAMAQQPNVYAKVTFLGAVPGGVWPYSEFHWMVRRVIDAFGPQRCMWGSNFPTRQFNPGATYAQHLDVFRKHLDLTDEERDWVTGRTAASLWRWKAP